MSHPIVFAGILLHFPKLPFLLSLALHPSSWMVVNGIIYKALFNPVHQLHPFPVHFILINYITSSPTKPGAGIVVKYNKRRVDGEGDVSPIIM